MKILIVSFVVALALVNTADADWPAHGRQFARAILSPSSGSKVAGTVDFAEVSDGLEVRAYLTHVPPGNHGFHIHALGNCRAADASSAGDHYNPTGQKHGSPSVLAHHVGDLGNILANDKGEASIDTIIPNPQSGKFVGWKAIVGRSVILHASKDDLTSQPTGNSGARIACGVIREFTGYLAE